MTLKIQTYPANACTWSRLDIDEKVIRLVQKERVPGSQIAVMSLKVHLILMHIFNHPCVRASRIFIFYTDCQSLVSFPLSYFLPLSLLSIYP